MSSEKSYVSTFKKIFQFGDIEVTGTVAIVDGEIGLTLSQVKSLFRLNEFLVRKTLNTMRIPYKELDGSECLALVEAGLIKKSQKKVIFLSKISTVELLLRIGTLEDLEFYDHLFEGEKKHKVKPVGPFWSNMRLSCRLLKLENEIKSLRSKIN